MQRSPRAIPVSSRAAGSEGDAGLKGGRVLQVDSSSELLKMKRIDLVLLISPYRVIIHLAVNYVALLRCWSDNWLLSFLLQNFTNTLH